MGVEIYGTEEVYLKTALSFKVKNQNSQQAEADL